MYFMRWNRSAIIGFLQANKSSANCGTFFYFTISVYRFDFDFRLPSIPLRPLPFHQEAVWPLHPLHQALRKYLHTLQKHGLLDIPILLPFDLLFSRFWFSRRLLSLLFYRHFELLPAITIIRFDPALRIPQWQVLPTPALAKPGKYLGCRCRHVRQYRSG